MKSGAGVPAWLGALLLVGVPAGLSGVAAAMAEEYLAWWLALLVGLGVFVSSGFVWLVFWNWLENRRDAKKKSSEEKLP